MSRYSATHLSWGRWLLDCPLFCLALALVLLISVISGKMARSMLFPFSTFNLTSRTDCSCHRSLPKGPLSAYHPPPGVGWDLKHKFIDLKKHTWSISSTRRLCIARQVAWRASNMDRSFKHQFTVEYIAITYLWMFKARFELGEHLGEDSHVLLGHPKVSPHLRNLLWLHVCKRRRLTVCRKLPNIYMYFEADTIWNLNPFQHKVWSTQHCTGHLRVQRFWENFLVHLCFDNS